MKYEKGSVIIWKYIPDTIFSSIRKIRDDHMKLKVIPEYEEMKQLGL